MQNWVNFEGFWGLGGSKMDRFGCLGPQKKANFSQNWKKQKKKKKKTGFVHAKLNFDPTKPQNARCCLLQKCLLQ
jgi:hypothetical protein